jgi:hypothetical protein
LKFYKTFEIFVSVSKKPSATTRSLENAGLARHAGQLESADPRGPAIGHTAASHKKATAKTLR